MPSGSHSRSRTPTEALEEIHGLAGANRISYEDHVRKRMRERGVTYEHLHAALMTARECVEEEAERWRVRGTDLSGDDLSIVVVLEDGITVVTLF